MNYIEMLLAMATVQARNGGAGEYFTIPQVMELTSASRSTVNRYLKAFMKRGLINKPRRGYYTFNWLSSLADLACSVSTPMELHVRQARYQASKKSA